MDTTNEWRAALDDQSKSFVTKLELAAHKEQLEDLKRRVEIKENKMAGFLQLIVLVSGLVTVAGIIFGIVRGLSH
jgi:hypothetical protein